MQKATYLKYCNFDKSIKKIAKSLYSLHIKVVTVTLKRTKAVAVSAIMIVPVPVSEMTVGEVAWLLEISTSE